MTTRTIANQILFDVIENHTPLHLAFDKHLNSKIDSRDKSFIKECCFGVLRWFHQLSAIEKHLLNSPLRKKDADIQILILLGLFQILYSSVPDHAAVSETVSVCKALRKIWAKSLVNKCLRRFIDEKETILSSIKETESDYSHPVWLIQYLKEAWPNRWEQILRENNKRPPMWLRLNLQKTSQKAYLEELAKNEIAAHASKQLPCAILLEKPIPIQSLPQFDKGFVSIQDLAGQFASQLLDLKKEYRVLDACAAPGSKTCHLLESQPEISKLVIVDKDTSRFPLIHENLKRLELNHKNIELIQKDVTKTKEWWDGNAFDRILLDAPCSSTGVIRRHPDIKLLRTEKEVHAVTHLQLQLLEHLWALLKKGGKLLYSTCSVLPEENEGVIASFLSTHEDAEIEKFELPFGEQQEFGVQLFPQESSCDGFYYALISKKA